MQWSWRTPFRTLVLFLALSFFVGYALAALTLGSFTNTYNEGGATYAPNPPTGVSFTSAGSSLASLTSPSSATKCTATDSSSSGSPGTLVSGVNFWVCLNSVVTTGYLASDSIYQATITWSTSAPTSTTYELSVYFGGATSSPVNAFVKTPATLSSSATAMVTFDLTSGGITSVTSVDVLVHQCVGSTCP